MPVIPGHIMMETDMSFDSIAKAGSMLGSGGVIVMSESRCMVRSLLRLSYFYYEESWPVHALSGRDGMAVENCQ